MMAKAQKERFIDITMTVPEYTMKVLCVVALSFFRPFYYIMELTPDTL